MDRILANFLFICALACICGAALLALAGFIDWLIHGRWPDQSVLRIAYDSRLLQAHWFGVDAWGLAVRDALAVLPAAPVAAALAPLCWWLSNRFGSR